MPSPPRPKRRPDYVFGINLNPDPLPRGVSCPKHLCYLACQPTRQRTREDRADEDKGEGGNVAEEAKAPAEAASEKAASRTKKVKKILVGKQQRKIGFLASLLPLGVGKMARELDRRDRRVKEWVEGPGSGEYGSDAGCSRGSAVGEDGGGETDDDGGEGDEIAGEDAKRGSYNGDRGGGGNVEQEEVGKDEEGGEKPEEDVKHERNVDSGKGGKGGGGAE